MLIARPTEAVRTATITRLGIATAQRETATVHLALAALITTPVPCGLRAQARLAEQAASIVGVTTGHAIGMETASNSRSDHPFTEPNGRRRKWKSNSARIWF